MSLSIPFKTKSSANIAAHEIPETLTISLKYNKNNKVPK